MTWFKKITQILTGLLATSTVIGCHSQADTPICIYGPPPSDDVAPAYPGDMEALQEANQAGADVPVAIYGPQPETGAIPAYPGDMEALQEANQAGADVPVAIYGPQPEAGAVPAYPGPDADNKANEKRDDAAREIDTLRQANEPQIRALYGVRPPENLKVIDR